LERRKITIARLRSGINYKEPLIDILDSFCYLYHRFQNENIDKFNFGYYNFGFNKAHRRDPKDMPDSDIIVIPSENEFHYHIPNYIDPKNLEKSDTAIKEHILPHIKGKHIIIFRSDRGDTAELYKEKVFNNIDCKVSVLDETDIPGNVHQLKYHFIQDIKQYQNNNKKYKFSYWGTEKRRDVGGVDSGDERHTILKQIQDGEGRFNTRFYGRFSLVKRDSKSVPMAELVPILDDTQYTLCFNWKSDTATTSRYHEAIACDVIPMVWKNYDSTGILVKDDWQRVSSVEELHDKMTEHNYINKILSITNSYKQSLLTKDEIYDSFEKKFLELLNE